MIIDVDLDDVPGRAVGPPSLPQPPTTASAAAPKNAARQTRMPAIYLNDRIHFITVAQSGHAPFSSGDSSSAAGSEARETGSNPNPAKYGSAVVVSA